MTTEVVTASEMKTHLLLGLDPICYTCSNVFSGRTFMTTEVVTASEMKTHLLLGL